MRAQGPVWIDRCMRAGYAARGVVYLLVGVLAVMAAWGGGRTAGPREALASLVGETGGSALLALVGLGLLGYAAWRVIDAVMDLEAYGSGAKGLFARGAMTVAGLVYLALGVYAFSLIGGGGGGSGGAEGLTAKLMAQPFGRWLVMLAGLAVIGAGGYYIAKAVTEKYKRELVANRTTEKLDPALKAGLIVQGIVIAIVGGFLLWAGWTHDASEAGGLGQALQAVREAPFGRWLLTAVGVGLALFALFCAVQARYRVLPGVAGPDTPTLGGPVAEVRSGARRAAHRAEAALRR
jgi:hypothetical protein